jgi:hypothetical protein
MHALGAGASAAGTTPELLGGTGGVTQYPVGEGLLAGTGEVTTGVGTASQVGVPNAATELAANGAASAIPTSVVPPNLPAFPTGAANAIPSLAAPPAVASTTGSVLRSGLNLAGSIANAIGNRQNANQYQSSINGLVERADTWGPENRQKAIDRIWQLYNDPSSIENTPGYEFARQQGEQGVNRAAAGRGYFRSPNMLYDLSKFNQGLATKTYDSEMNRLMAMAGVNNNPASAAQIGAQGAQNYSSMNRTSLTSALAAGGTFIDWLSGLNFG